MITEKSVRQIETIESNGLDKELIKKRGNSKTFNGWLIQRIKESRKQNFETAMFLQELYNKYMEFEKTEKFQAEQWRGKSGVQFIIEPHRVIAERYRKSDRYQKPKKITSELLKQEINRVIWAINDLNIGKIIETREIAEKVYNKSWKQVFSTRKEHIKLVEILNYLEYRKDIHYSRSGKIKVLGQTKLNDF